MKRFLLHRLLPELYALALILLILAVVSSPSWAQSPPYAPEPPANVPAMPAASATLTAGVSRIFSWQPVTEWNDNSAITGNVYYDLWQVSASGTLTLIASGITGTTYTIASLPAGLDCYVVDANAQEAAGSLPPYGESNASNGHCLQVNAPAPTAKTPYGPDNFTSSAPPSAQ